MPRPRYPSDHRRWFRVMEDILDSPKFTAEEWALGAYVRLLAMLNRTKSRDGSIQLSPAALALVMGRRRGDLVGKRLARGAHLRLWSAARYADYTLIMVRNWPKTQQLAPTELRRGSVETPATTPTPTPTPITLPSGVGNPAPPDPPEPLGANAAPLANLIAKLDGDPDEKLAWLESGVGLEINAAADVELLDDATPKQRTGKLTQITSARWRTYLKTDRPFRGAGERARAREKIAVLKARDAARDPPAAVSSVPPEMARMFDT